MQIKYNFIVLETESHLSGCLKEQINLENLKKKEIV